MQRITRIITACLALTIAISFTTTQTSHGEDRLDIITDNQVRAIRTQCTELQATLHRIYQSDAVLRHNRGQLYKTISDKLMVPLNQRVASNQLDGSGLVAITALFNTTYEEFYDAYKDYEGALSKAMGVDCTKNPTQFYDAVADAREKRTLLYMSSSKLVQLADRYQEEFDVFRSEQAKKEKSE
ncbi:MAG: hypothetical protein ACSLEY_02995 [Candidatus Saccharimonadales bacterium]